MNKISQKRDIDDANMIFEFAKKVQSLEQLKLLFIFTVADMKATGKVIWNNWNKYPLEQLFLVPFLKYFGKFLYSTNVENSEANEISLSSGRISFQALRASKNAPPVTITICPTIKPKGPTAKFPISNCVPTPKADCCMRARAITENCFLRLVQY